MSERMTGISIDKLFSGNHNDPRIAGFIGEFSGVLHSGEGRKPIFLAGIGIDTDFPLKLLVGLPKKSLTREQRLLAEAYASIFFGLPLGKNMDDIWTARPAWKPVNPDRIAAPLQESHLDADWMIALGVSKAIWEKQILISKDALVRGLKQQAEQTTLRLLLALSVYGFSDPYQFFTSAE
jgi:hypothetical protein